MLGYTDHADSFFPSMSVDIVVEFIFNRKEKKKRNRNTPCDLGDAHFRFKYRTEHQTDTEHGIVLHPHAYP